ncbi:MAG: PIN domain-containing protein [Burkholderiales bacterium]|nr:PIN domain-containing protein [Burkholderiales bacterium]MCL4689661.1 PIN domain-containing protein [Burkholderiales bacterium]
MRAVDTNVLVRLITRDDPRQVAAAEAFVEGGAWVSILALAEATWVLASAYELDAEKVATAIEMLLEHRHLVLQDADVAAAALGRLRANPALGYSDCLLVELARKAGHTPLGTFDRGLAKVDGAVRI